MTSLFQELPIFLSTSSGIPSKVDPNRKLVSNIGRATVKMLAFKSEENEILSLDDFDVFACYRDLWKTDSEKWNAVRQGIIHSHGFTLNCMKLRINAKDKDAINAQDDAIAEAYGNKFIIPLDFEMLDNAMPYYQARLENRLCYEITFNDYGNVINATGQAATLDATYKITDIALEYEIVTQPDIASHIATEYQSTVLFYRHRQIPVNKLDTTWNWPFNTSCRSLKGILVLFEAEK